MKNISLDASMLTTLMACETLFDYTFNQDLVSVQGKAPALGTGSLAHFIAEHFAKARINGKSYSDSVNIGFEAGKEYVKAYSPINKFMLDTEHIGIENVPATTDDGRITSVADVVSTMEQYFDTWKNDSSTILEAEVTKKRLIYEDSDIRILWAAKLDQIIDTPMSIMSRDIKTSKSDRGTASLNNQFIGQCHVLGSRYVEVDNISFAKTVTKDKKFKRVRLSYSLRRLEEWRTNTLPYYANMYVAYTEANNWPMRLTHCENKFGRCRFYDICEADDNIREELLRVYFRKGPKWDISNNEE